MKKLVYLSVFHNEQYLNMLRLFVESLALSETDTNNFDILIFTQDNMVNEIRKIFEDFNIEVRIECMNLIYSEMKLNQSNQMINILDASQISLRIWELNEVHEYDTFLYLDTDVIITGDLNQILNADLENKLYAEQQRKIRCSDQGRQFFDFSKIDRKTSGFCAGVLLFKNCNEMKNLFAKTLNHIKEHIDSEQEVPRYLEQPFLVYHAITDDLYSSALSQKIKSSGKIMYHFYTCIGKTTRKIKRMNKLLNELREKVK